MNLTSSEAALLERIARSSGAAGYEVFFSTLPADARQTARHLFRQKLISSDWDDGHLCLTPAGAHALASFHEAQQQQAEERQRHQAEHEAELMRSDDQAEKDRRVSLAAAVVSSVCGAILGSIGTLIVQYLLSLK